MNCKAVPLQSPVSHSAHWVEMDKNNEPQRGSTMHLTKFVVRLLSLSNQANNKLFSSSISPNSFILATTGELRFIRLLT